MIRVIGEPLLFFSLPFIAYALFVLLFSSSLEPGKPWSMGHVSRLVIAGLAAALAGLLLIGLESGHNKGAYIPAHIENGQLVPSRWE